MNKNLSHNELQELCRYGSLSPSVHNVQPWVFQIGKNMISVLLSDARRLSAGDMTGRETWISIGACVESIVVAAESLGFDAEVKVENLEKVIILFSSSSVPKSSLVKYISQRYNDRSTFNKRPLTQNNIKKIQDAWGSKTASVVIIDKTEEIALVSGLVSKGISLALSSPAFRTELSELILRPASKRKVGIPSGSLRLGFIAGLLEPIFVRYGLGIKRRARSENNVWLSSKAVLLVFTKGDNIKYWIAAGRAYQRVALTVTQLGLSQAVSAAPVEALDFHEDIEKMVGTKQRLQVVMRVGYSSANPTKTPRLKLKDVVLDSF